MSPRNLIYLVCVWGCRIFTAYELYALFWTGQRFGWHALYIPLGPSLPLSATVYLPVLGVLITACLVGLFFLESNACRWAVGVCAGLLLVKSSLLLFIQSPHSTFFSRSEYLLSNPLLLAIDAVPVIGYKAMIWLAGVRNPAATLLLERRSIQFQGWPLLDFK